MNNRCYLETNWPLSSNYFDVSLDISPIRNGISPMGNVDDVLSSSLEQTFDGKNLGKQTSFRYLLDFDETFLMNLSAII